MKSNAKKVSDEILSKMSGGNTSMPEPFDEFPIYVKCKYCESNNTYEKLDKGGTFDLNRHIVCHDCGNTYYLPLDEV